mgnify:CR=1 FL=1
MSRALEVLQGVFRELPGMQVTYQGERRIKTYPRADALPALLELLKGRAGFLHLSAISCVDWPEQEELELVYHLWSYQSKVLVSAHVRIPRHRPRFVSVYDIHVPAGFFERDIHEMFGVYFEGAPDMEKFILTEWHGPPPMLKTFSTEQYVEDTYEWREYRPQWLRDVEAKGGGLEK